MLRVLFFGFLCIHFTLSDIENIHKRHEYNLTFKGPIIILPNTNEIPFFEIGGHIIPGKDRVRLTTSLPDQQGWIWSKGNASFEGFQIDIIFKITGSGRIGADGMALWIVKNKSSGGHALGASNIWNGLGIFFDTYDNDGHNDNPIISAIVNDGTKFYDSNTDGRELSIGHCIRDFRNRPNPVHSKIIYFNQTLELLISSGIDETNPILEECFKIKVNLPRDSYYFGLSAATGTLADDHDVEKFEVHSLISLKNLKKDEENKILEETKLYEEDYQKRLDNITQTGETHTASQTTQPSYSDLSKNLLVIWQEIARQNKILKDIMNNVLDLHNAQSSKSSSNAENELVSQIDSMRKEFVSIKSSVDSLARKIESPSNTYQQQQSVNQLQVTLENMKLEMLKEFGKITTLQNGLHQIQEKIQKVISSKSKEGECEFCISLTALVVVGFMQAVSVIGFMIYQRNKDNSAKKFY